MKILLIADTHDIHAHIRLAIAQASRRHELSAIFHAGDLALEPTLDVLAEAELPVYYTIGNNEDDPEGLALRCQELGFHFLGEQAEVTIDGRSCAITHYPRIAQSLATFGEYDLICFGDSHKAMKQQLPHGGWLVNPGNLAGWREQARYAVYDSTKHSVTHYDVEVRQKSWHFA